jgi:succinyl-CoA synthetase beta subunit
MNLHEYQGKNILNSFGVKIQRGTVATTPEEAVAAAKKLTEETGTGWHVIKAQVHAGGRGKGGGVKLAKNLDEVQSIANQILGMQLGHSTNLCRGEDRTPSFSSRRCILSWPYRNG